MGFVLQYRMTKYMLSLPIKQNKSEITKKMLDKYIPSKIFMNVFIM